jgi:hypothetical protein
MGRIEDEGATLLAPLRDAEPSMRSGVDVTRAMRAGRRHQRNRLVVGVVAAVTLVALPAFTLPALVHNFMQNTPAAPPVGEFDMFKQVMTVGTAGGFTPYSYRTGRFEQAVDLGHTFGGTGSARVTMYAQGRSGPINTSEPAENVNGLLAYWQSGLKDPTLAVRWAENGWAIVTANSGTDLDIVDRTHRIAQSVGFNVAHVAVKVPFKFVKMPVGPSLRVVGVTEGIRSMSAQVLLSTSDETGAPVLAIGAAWEAPNDSTPNDMIDGHEAIVGDKSVSILNVDGKGAQLSVRYDDVAQVGGISGLKVIATSTELVPDATNRANWTDQFWVNPVLPR